MAVVVIGGQASGVGKTGLICSLIRAMPERRWTAIKITQCSHADWQKCDCGLGGASVAICEERVAGARTDSSRYLAAGAARSLWVRTAAGQLGDAMPRVREEIAGAENVILESNSVLDFLVPDFYALIVSSCVRDFKASARRYLNRADAILMATPPPGHEGPEPAWMDELREQLERIPQFAIAQPELASPSLLAFTRRRLGRKTRIGSTDLS